jgi:hypothetical protein
MTRRGMIGLLGSAVTASLSACVGPIDRRVTRYRMTVEVDTPEGVRRGEVVREASSMFARGSDGSSQQAKVRGEAVAVDLPSNKTLFALLSNDSIGHDYAAFVPMITGLDQQSGGLGGLFAEPVEIYPDCPKGKNPRPCRYYLPIFVTFGDIRDPKSVKRVDPPNLAKAFGPGSRCGGLLSQ